MTTPRGMPVPLNDELKMDVGVVRSVALDVEEVAHAMEGFPAYLREAPLKEGDLGGSPKAPVAIAAVNAAVNNLAQSTDHAHKYLLELSQRIKDSAAKTRGNDVDSAWALKKAGGK